MSRVQGQVKRALLFFYKAVSLVLYLSLLLSYLSPFIHPDTSIVLAFLGLAYPILVIAVLFSTLIWLFFNSKWAFVSILILMIGGKIHFRTFSMTLFESKIGEHSFELMSYNVRLFDIYNKDFNEALKTKNKILEFIRFKNPDILCIQEFYRQDNTSRFVTRDSIFNSLQTTYYHEKCSFNPHGSQYFGIALFSKLPIVSKGEVRINKTDESSFNYCIYVDVLHATDTLRIYNVHLQSIKLYDEYFALKKEKMTGQNAVSNSYKKLSSAFIKRSNQAQIILNHIKTSPYPSIVAGDFNDTPMSYTYNLFNRNLIDAYRNTSFGIGATYLGKLPAGRIDYIFHSKELKSNNFVIDNNSLSDHCAISCTISK